jgi:hypothetical protein
MPANHASQQTLVPQVIQPPVHAIPLSRRIHQGQVTRFPFSLEAFLKGEGESFRVGTTDESSHGDGGAISDRRNGLFGTKDWDASHLGIVCVLRSLYG